MTYSYSFLSSSIGHKAAPVPAPKMVAIITLKPLDIKLNSGMYLSSIFIAIETSIIINMDLDFLAGGIIIAINIAYKAIPIALLMDCDNAEQVKAPKAVPKLQPTMGPVISPSI